MNEEIKQKLDNFFSRFTARQFKKGEVLIRAEDVPPGIFYLTKGIVKMYGISKKGDEMVLNIFKPDAFFPMNWAVNETPNKYYYEALEDTQVWRAPREDVVVFIKENPDVLYSLLSRVYRGVDGVLSRMAYLMTGSAYDRLVAEILIHAKRFGSVKDDSIELKVSEKDLALSAGLTRETVSREIKILKEKGLVRLGSNVIVIQSIGNLEEELTANS